jgi:FkbM family methyltransferase
MTVEMIPTTINGQWTLALPTHRAARPEWKTGWETERIASMFEHIGAGGRIIYDVGAEEGDLPALWASWGNDVVAFEPNAKVWPNIKVIFDANGLVPLATFSGFAADHDGDRDVEFIGRRESGVLWPTSSYGPVIGDHGFCNLCERPDIPRVKIDTVADVVGPPDAISCDVEGAELRVLLGAERVLREHRPLVWVSVHPQFMMDTHRDTPDDLFAYMTKVGYVAEHLATDHEEHWLFSPA